MRFAARRASVAVAAGALVAAVAVATWLLSGVGVAEIAAFCAYQLAWVVVPGLVFHRLLDPAARGLERLVVGWTLGYAISIAAFATTAALGIRELFLAVPLLPLAAVPFLGRRPRRDDEDRATEVSPIAQAGLGIVASLGIVFVALLLVPLTPLPGTTTAAYPPDPMFHLSVAAEARHHWPVTDPKIAGTPLPYHLFANYDMAAVNQVTGIELPVAVLRLAYVPLVILTALAVGLLAALAGSRGAGVPLAAALFLFVGELDLQPSSLYPFWGGTFFGLTFSPSFLLSAPVFGALLAVAWRLIVASERGVGLWLLLAALAWTLGGAKGGSLAVLVGGCLLYALMRLVRDRTLDRRAFAVAAVAVAIVAVQSVVVYRGAGTGGLELRFLGAVRSSSAVDALVNAFAVVGPLGSLAAWMFGVFAIMGAPVLAAVWAGRDRPTWLLYGSVLATALVPFLVFTHPGESQLYLTQLGLMAATALAGAGLERLFRRSAVGTPARRFLLLAASAWILALVLLAYLPSRAGYEGSKAHVVWYGGAVVLGAALYAAAASLRTVRPLLGRLAVVMILLAAALNVPLDTVAPLARAERSGTPISAGNDVTPALYEGLSWLRRNTTNDAVLAVNNHNTSRGRFDNFVYSALAERRVFLEGWLYSIPTIRAGERDVASGREMPFADRKRLNDNVFRGDRRALDVLVTRYGVRYLVVDKLHGEVGERMDGLGRVVYSNAAVDIVAVGS